MAANKFMKKSAKNYLERKTFLGTLARRRRFERLKKKYVEWETRGAALPMPHWGKQLIVSEYAQRFSLPVFVETGTYNGAMVYAVLNRFEKIFSVELDPRLFNKAQERFSGYRHVHLFRGESSEVLPEILSAINSPCLFWLDAHWSGGGTARGQLETPVVKEVRTLLKHRYAEEHVLLIDDARCFTGENDYPELVVLQEFFSKHLPKHIFEVKDDIIRVHGGI